GAGTGYGHCKGGGGARGSPAVQHRPRLTSFWIAPEVSDGRGAADGGASGSSTVQARNVAFGSACRAERRTEGPFVPGAVLPEAGRRPCFRGPVVGTLLQRRVQPGASVGPGAVRGAGGDAEGFSDLGNRQPREVAQLDDLRRRRIDALEPFQRLMDCEDVQRRLRRLDLPVFDRLALKVATPPQR